MLRALPSPRPAPTSPVWRACHHGDLYQAAMAAPARSCPRYGGDGRHGRRALAATRAQSRIIDACRAGHCRGPGLLFLRLCVRHRQSARDHHRPIEADLPDGFSPPSATRRTPAKRFPDDRFLRRSLARLTRQFLDYAFASRLFHYLLGRVFFRCRFVQCFFSRLFMDRMLFGSLFARRLFDRLLHGSLLCCGLLDRSLFHDAFFCNGFARRFFAADFFATDFLGADFLAADLRAGRATGAGTAGSSAFGFGTARDRGFGGSTATGSA